VFVAIVALNLNQAVLFTTLYSTFYVLSLVTIYGF